MTPTSRELLTRLGQGESINDICAAAGWDRPRFDAWWGEECRRRVPPAKGTQTLAGLKKGVRITRDRWGIPHVQADNDHDLFFGFGYATAQDRLFQLEHLRRKARGTLAEVMGPEAVESDLLYRTIGLAKIADAELRQLPAETAALLDAYTAGINALIEASRAALPIEFDLLGYEPAPWRATDSLVIEGEFRWYLTGRFPVICIPELAKRTLGDGPLYRAFLAGEEDEESMLQSGEYVAAKESPWPQVIGSPDPSGAGSNNWVLGGTRTAAGRPIVANDPHVPFYAVSIWHEVVLRGGSFQVAGVTLAGMPAVMIGRNPRVAWGITNNICSLRDLYQEKTDPAHAGCYLHDGKWEPARAWDETIAVKGGDPVVKRLRASRNGPIVDDILPAAARSTGPVSIRWVGFDYCGWLTALLGMGRARTCAEFRQATRPWCAPTFNLVFADADGHAGYQCVGRIPIRRNWDRGYRPGWDPQHQWHDYIPFEGLPHLIDPPRGFVVTANNRTAPDDYPYPLSGTWSGGYRARRIREMIEARPKQSRESCQAMQLDVRSRRAARAVWRLVGLFEHDSEPRIQRAISFLKDWDYASTKDSVAATLFNVFFTHWSRAVARERFAPDGVELVAASVGGLALQLLRHDETHGTCELDGKPMVIHKGTRDGRETLFWACGSYPAGCSNIKPIDLNEAGEPRDQHGRPLWFRRAPLNEAITAAFVGALDELTQKLGPDISQWRWGRIHTLLQKHFLSSRGELGQLLDRSGLPLNGDGHTVNSSTPDPSWAAWLGAGYRMVADMADPRGGLWAIEVGSASGHPGSPHYDDQIAPWSAGEYHYLALDDQTVDGPTFELRPQ